MNVLNIVVRGGLVTAWGTLESPVLPRKLVYALYYRPDRAVEVSIKINPYAGMSDRFILNVLINSHH